MVRDVWTCPRACQVANRDPGGDEGIREGDSLVVEGVELGGDDERRRKVRQRAEERGGLGVDPVGGVRIVVPEPPHQ